MEMNGSAKVSGDVIDGLNQLLDGSAYGPASDGWDEARAAWNLAVDQHPACVVVPTSADDVSAAVKFAGENGLWVTAQGTGHSAAAYDSLAGALLIKTSEMQELSIDHDTRIARVGAGVTWGAVVPAAAEHGLIALAGSSHDVGVVGYHLGGGLSFLARKHGLASDWVRAIELVKADGTQVRVSADDEPDLFWALRGGGGNFGVVTALEFELLPMPELCTGSLFFAPERTAEVFQAWRRWTADLPNEMSTTARMLSFPPFPEIPEVFRGKSFAIIEAVWLGDEPSGSKLLEPLRELGPDNDTFQASDPMGLLALHMDPPGPVPGFGDHMLLGEITEGEIEALVDAVGPGSGVPILGFEMRLLGGALDAATDGGGATSSLRARFLTYGVGVLAAPEMRPPLEKGFRDAREALAGSLCDSNALNFTEVRVEPGAIFGTEALARLREVKSTVDEGGLIRGNHLLT
ncbi:hypothetical protein BH10ACT11_BH10ACT11_12240 [soil metagenome]